MAVMVLPAFGQSISIRRLETGLLLIFPSSSDLVLFGDVTIAERGRELKQN
jgi:hypothetical protein